VAILAPLCALATAVWAVILVRWGSVLAFAMVVLLAGTIFGPDFYHYNGPFQVSSERILWAALIGFFVIHWRLGKTDLKPLSRGDWVLIGFTIVTVISSKFGPPMTDGSNPFARWLFFIAMPTGLYFAVRSANIQARELRWITNFIILMGLYMAVTAVLEHRGVYGLVFPRYIASPKIWEFYGRGRGPLLNPAGIGVVMTAALGAAMTRWLNTGRFGQLAYGAAILLLLLGCYSTLTRCVWIGAAATVGFITYLHMPKLMRVWAITAGLIAVVGLGGVVASSLLKIKRDKNLSAEESKNSVELRPLLAVLAIDMFQDRPLTGHGFGRYLETHKKYVEDPSWNLPLANALGYHQHNIVLSILVDCGLIGAAMYVAMMINWVRNGFRLYHDKKYPPEIHCLGMTTLAIMIGYFVNGMFQDVLIVSMVNMYVWFFAGLCSGVIIRGGFGAVENAAKEVSQYAVPSGRDRCAGHIQTT
jgi:O-antigen ligase